MTDEQRKLIDSNIAALSKGQQLRVDVDDHHNLVMLTDQEGFHSRRPRYLVVCVTCETLLHEATTGPVERMVNHMQDGYRTKQ
jgi:hypothetical protein